MDSRGLTGKELARAVEGIIPRIATVLRPDVLSALVLAREGETSERSRLALDQLIENAKIARETGAPICQDTGTVWVYLEVGEEEVVPGTIFSEVDAAVARAYEKARLRMSLVRDALIDRGNTRDNTPAFCEIGFRPGKGATLHVMLKGGGSDNASRVVMLPPAAGRAGIEEAVLACIREKASSACPPLIVGIGIGATFDKVAPLAKKALLREVTTPAKHPEVAAFEKELLEKINATGIGPAGLGGATTALAVHINTAPCHIAALPLAINMGCSAMRSESVEFFEGRFDAV